MGKKTTGRLAGLAALAAAAYMANKGKGESASGPTVTPTPEIAPAPAPAVKEENAVESGDFLSRRLNRMDTDDGKLYSTNNLSPMSSPAKVARVASSVKNPVAKSAVARAPTIEDEYAAQEKLMGAYKPRNPNAKLKDVKSTTKSGKKTLTTTPYADEFKRGGAVKKMASGGMTSKRGDGIASKGKTRCKIC